MTKQTRCSESTTKQCILQTCVFGIADQVTHSIDNVDISRAHVLPSQHLTHRQTTASYSNSNMNFSILFCLVVSLVAARHGVFAPKRVAVERCFAYPAADDPKYVQQSRVRPHKSNKHSFLHCLQNLICTPGPTFPNATTTATNATAPPAPPPTSSVSFPSPCSPDGACDCSQIEDKNGDE